MLMIDEFHHLLTGTARKQGEVRNVIKYIGNELRIPLVALGTKEALRFLRSDPHLDSRFDKEVLPNWKKDVEYGRLLVSFERTLPLAQPSNLKKTKMAARLLTMSEGLLGELSKILTRAAVVAIQTGTERINEDALNALKWVPVSKQAACGSREASLGMLSGNLWPVHPQPLPDELLSSWLIRSAKGNKQKLQNFTTLAVADLEVWWRDIDKSASLRLLLPLSFRSGVSVERLYRTTLWSYAGRLYAKHDPSNSNRWTLRAGTFRRKNKRRGLQYCPLCLAREPLYFQRIWRLAFVTVCPEHGTRLRDHCSSCNAPIAPHKVDVGAHTESRVPSGIPVNRCYECGADLSAVETSPSEKADMSVSAFQAHLLSVLESDSVTLSADGLSSVAYFDGLRILVTALMGLRYTRPFSTYVAQHVGLSHVDFDLKATSNDFEYQPSEHRYEIMAMLAWLMKDWPERFISTYARTGMTQPKLLNIWSDVPTWLEAIILEAHGARARFKEERRALLGPYRDLSEQDRSDLHDFLEHGADRMDIANERVADLRSLIDRGYLTTLDSSSGEFVFLTTRGRSALGAHQGDCTLRAAAGHVIRRRVRERFEAQGWRYIQKEGSSLISLRSPEGKKRYLLCGHGKYGRVVVARRLSTLKERLREENAVLMVVSEEPEKLMVMKVVKEGWLEVIDSNFVADVEGEL